MRPKLGNRQVTEYWRKVFDGSVEMGKLRIRKFGNTWEYAYYDRLLKEPGTQAPLLTGRGYSSATFTELNFTQDYERLFYSGI